MPPFEKWDSNEESWKKYQQKYQYDKNQDESKSGETEKNPTQIQGECRPKFLISRIKEDEGLIAAAEKACKNKDVQDDINHLMDQLSQGNMNPGN